MCSLRVYNRTFFDRILWLLQGQSGSPGGTTASILVPIIYDKTRLYEHLTNATIKESRPKQVKAIVNLITDSGGRIQRQIVTYYMKK